MGMLQRAKDLAAEYAYVVTLLCVVGVIVGSAAYTRRVQERTQEMVAAAAQAPEVMPTPTQTPVMTPLPTVAPLEPRAVAAGGLWPVEGEVLRGHEAGEIVYWAALDAWQAHTGIDVAGEAGGAVRCAAAGTVKSVTRDALWGASVSVLQEDGREAVYRGLALCGVRRGERVQRGQEIGTLLESVPCEGEMAAHLHMELCREGRMQDPLTMLQER